MKFKKLLSLLTASVMSAGCILQSGIANAMAEENESVTQTGDVSQDLQNPIDYETISGLQKFLSGEGNDDENSDLDMDKNGTVDVFDLAIARGTYKYAARLNNFRSDIADILLNQEEIVTFTVDTNGTNVLNEAIKLFDDDNEPVAEMHDDGKNGDKTADDGIYSAQLELVSDDFKNVDYYAATDHFKSDSYRVCFYREFTEEEFTAIDDLLSRVSALETLEEAVEFFENSEEVSWHNVDEENEIISYKTIYHTSGCWQAKTEGTFGGSGYYVELGFLNVVTPIIIEEAASIINSLKFTPAHPENNEMLLILQTDDYPDSNDILEGMCNVVADALNWNLTVKKTSDVSIELMKNLSGYGMVVYNSHGTKYTNSSGDVIPLTYTGTDLRTATAYHGPSEHAITSADFTSERILGCGNVLVISPLFYDYYYPPNSLDGSFWYLANCHDMCNDTYAEALLRKGAESVIGYSNILNAGYLASTFFETVINSMLLNADTVGNGVASAIAIKGDSHCIKTKTFPILGYLYPDVIITKLRLLGNKDFRLVEDVEPLPPIFPDEPDFVADNTLNFVEHKDADGRISYGVSGKTGNIDVVIPSTYNGCPVDVVGSFRQCKHLRSITIPSSVKVINDYAFQKCESLKKVDFMASSVEKIGTSVFSYTGIEEIELNLNNHFDDLYGMFTGCKELKKATINGSVEKLSFTFSECPSLESVELPNDLKILKSTFNGCTSLTEFTVPDGVEEIGSYSFNFCTALEKVYMPDSITKIGQDAFSNCSKLYTVVMPKQLYSIGTRAFSGCRNLKDMHMPEVLYRIESQAFQNSSLGDFKIPDTVTYIGISAFSGCVNSRFYGLPANIKEICDEAFERCRFIYADNIFMKLTLPETLEKFEPTAFYNSDVDYLYILNPDMEFIVDNATNKSKLSYVLKYTKFFGYEGSTTQAFAEDPSHTCEFIAIGSENDFINKK